MGIFNLFRKNKKKSKDDIQSIDPTEKDDVNDEPSSDSEYIPPYQVPIDETRNEKVPAPYQLESSETSSYQKIASESPGSIPPGEYKLYVWDEDHEGSILEIPATEAIHEVPPPKVSQPPYVEAVPTTHHANPISQELENLPSVFREETHSYIESLPSERAIGPVYVPSLIEAAAMYRQWIFENSEEATSQACSMWEAYLELCPNDIDAHVGYGWVIFELCGLEDAIFYFQERLATIDHPVPIFMALADLCTRAGDYGAAAQYYMEVIEILPNDVHVLAALANVQREAGFEQAALETEANIYELSNGVWRGPEQD